MVEMKVKTIAADQEQKNPVMILTDAEEKRYLPIWIGGPEAWAILMEMNGMNYPRPMTHDLLKNVIETLNCKVRRIVVTDLEDLTYYARIVVDCQGKEIEIDARPSDSVALALRCQAPIFVSEKVMQTASPNEEKLAEEKKKFKEFIKNVSADMFSNPDIPARESPDEKVDQSKPPTEE